MQICVALLLYSRPYSKTGYRLFLISSTTTSSDAYIYFAKCGIIGSTVEGTLRIVQEAIAFVWTYDVPSEVSKENGRPSVEVTYRDKPHEIEQ